MSETLVYRIRNKDGLWSSGGSYPCFSKKGKTWNNLGHVKTHLATIGAKERRECYKDAELVTIVIREENTEAQPMLEVIQRIEKLKDLRTKHGGVFSKMFDQLEQKGQLQEFRYCLVFYLYTYGQEFKDLQELIKRLGGTRKNTRVNDSCFVFSDKKLAAAVRLSTTLRNTSIDLVNLAEDIDF